MRASEVLEAAKQKILDDGWWKGGDSDSNNGRATCVVLSIDGSVDVHLARDEVVLASNHALEFVKEAIGVTSDDCGKVYEWNDAPERTLTDVLDAFDMAVKLAREDEALAHAERDTFQDESMEVGA